MNREEIEVLIDYLLENGMSVRNINNFIGREPTMREISDTNDELIRREIGIFFPLGIEISLGDLADYYDIDHGLIGEIEDISYRYEAFLRDLTILMYRDHNGDWYADMGGEMLSQRLAPSDDDEALNIMRKVDVIAAWKRFPFSSVDDRMIFL